jgi:hypothetical protein
MSGEAYFGNWAAKTRFDPLFRLRSCKSMCVTFSGSEWHFLWIIGFLLP